jgi:hypothetical protein
MWKFFKQKKCFKIIVEKQNSLSYNSSEKIKKDLDLYGNILYFFVLVLSTLTKCDGI